MITIRVNSATWCNKQYPYEIVDSWARIVVNKDELITLKQQIEEILNKEDKWRPGQLVTTNLLKKY